MKIGKSFLCHFSRVVAVGLAFFAADIASADNPVVNVEGSYTYYATPKDSRDDARRIALQEARNDALAREFGTIVQSTQLSTTKAEGNRESNKFLALSSTESKGEWIADSGEPEFKFDLDPKEGTLVVTCKVRGSAMAISNEATDFSAVVSRNGSKSKNSETLFNSGDQLFLTLNAPVNGYAVVFLADESGNVFQMLPYPGSHVDEIKIRKNEVYRLFDSSVDDGFGQVQEMLMTAPDGLEYNQLYVLFSPNVFSLPATTWNGNRVPPSTSQESFARWLVKSRKADPRLGVQQINLTINPEK